MPKNSNQLFVRPTLLALAAAACVSAIAQESTQTLSEVVVSAAGFEQEIKDAPATISVVTQEDLAKKPYTSLVDAVRDIEGVDIGETADKTGQRTISLRGLGADYTLILIDGKRQSNHGDIYPNGFSGNQFNHIPPLDTIERIEVIRGPASTLYGTDAMGGVINIITKKIATKWSGSATVSHSIQEYSEYGNDKTSDFNLSGPLSEKIGLSIRGSFYDKEASKVPFESTVDPDGNTVTRAESFGDGRGHVANDSRALGFTASFTPDSRQNIKFDYDISRQEFDNSDGGVGTLDSAETLLKNSRVGYNETQKYQRDNWAITHEGKWDFGKSLISLSYVESSNKGRSMPLSAAERKLLDSIKSNTGLSNEEKLNSINEELLPRSQRELKNEQYIVDAKLDIPLSGNSGDHMLILGGQAINGKMVDSVYGLESGKAGGSQSFKTYALFAENNWMPNDKFTLTTGLRYDHHNAFGNNFSPRLYGVYILNNAWTFKGGISTGYKTPKTSDIYDGIIGFGSQGTSPWVGNPDLKPEKSVNTEVSAYWSHPDKHRFNITYFNTDFKDKIESSENAVISCEKTGGIRPCVNMGDFTDILGSYKQKINLAKATVQGIELAGRYQITNSVALRGNYTWTDSKIKDGPQAKIGLPLTNMAKHMANLTFEWQVNAKWSTYLTNEYRSKRYSGTDENGDEIYWKSYNVLHLGSSYEVNKNVTLNARINNLLDKDFTKYSTTFAKKNGAWVATYRDEYNNKDKRRSLWISLNAKF